jgi:hypothetical protein
VNFCDRCGAAAAVTARYGKKGALFARPILHSEFLLLTSLIPYPIQERPKLPRPRRVS